MSELEVPVKYTAQEQRHLEVLERRLDWLRSTDAFADGEGYTLAEARALGWVLDVLHGLDAPMEVRMVRMEKHIRSALSRLGRVERLLEEEDD